MYDDNITKAGGEERKHMLGSSYTICEVKSHHLKVHWVKLNMCTISSIGNTEITQQRVIAKKPTKEIK